MVDSKEADAEVEAEAKAASCCGGVKGPGFSSPKEAQHGPREKIVYITGIYTGEHARAQAALHVQIWMRSRAALNFALVCQCNILRRPPA